MVWGGGGAKFLICIYNEQSLKIFFFTNHLARYSVTCVEKSLGSVDAFFSSSNHDPRGWRHTGGRFFFFTKEYIIYREKSIKS